MQPSTGIRSRFLPQLFLASIAVAGLVSAQQSVGQSPPDVTRYTATTTNLDPGERSLRFDVLSWSDAAARAAVASALQSDDVPAALDELPTVGYVWPDGSPVGYALKYAHSDEAASGEKLTFVTSRRLGSYDFGGWSVVTGANTEELDYSVIELELADGGESTGTASLAAAVDIDADASLVRLAPTDDTPVLFADVRRVTSAY